MAKVDLLNKKADDMDMATRDAIQRAKRDRIASSDDKKMVRVVLFFDIILSLKSFLVVEKAKSLMAQFNNISASSAHSGKKGHKFDHSVLSESETVNQISSRIHRLKVRGHDLQAARGTFDGQFLFAISDNSVTPRTARMRPKRLPQGLWYSDSRRPNR